MTRIEQLRLEDVEASVALHLDHLRLGLFPRLGQRFMRFYHETFIHSPHGVALVAREGGEVIGVLFGTASNAAHYRWVVRNRSWKLGATGLAALLSRPMLALKFMTTRGPRYARAIMRRLSPASKSRGGSGAPLPVLSHVVTAPDVRQRGVGRKLVKAFAQQVRRDGAQAALLVTEEDGLGTPFFERIGARLAAKRIGQDGVPVREYRLTLGDASRYENTEPDRTGRPVFGPNHARIGPPEHLSARAGHSPG
ncbi:GNAT family N-acetyltransferase [Pelagibacterium limicola]|uniref:GNAT family N-acetyltransferase n=1 Tax=Pelagibacterium limicola TaxID=2791022 RepID=UPI0018AFB60C|nr:GNAT family N-acetyltransferase [Pelagibacterium limicola]